MSIINRLSVIVLGIMIGVLVAFAADMLFLQGRFVAHHLRDRQSDCGLNCHAQPTNHHTLWI